MSGSDSQADSATDGIQRRLGLVLNSKWKLDELLGIGGMAAVYGATHRNGNRVAIKILHDHCAANDNIRSRFQREGYVANKIEHWKRASTARGGSPRRTASRSSIAFSTCWRPHT